MAFKKFRPSLILLFTQGFNVVNFSAILLIAIVNTVAGQTSATSKPRIVEASFIEEDIELLKNSIVNNTLRVVNNTRETKRFTVDFTIPIDWKLIGDPNTLYEVNAGDSLFIPLRMKPTLTIKGNTHFTINAFLISEDNIQLQDAYFFLHVKKIIKWELTAGPAEKIYFLNNSNSARFSMNILNLGNEKEQMEISSNSIGHNILLEDTNENILKSKFQVLSLAPHRDSTLSYQLKCTEGLDRNVKRIDVENYIPQSDKTEKKYTLFFLASQPLRYSSSVYQTRRRIQFIKLSDTKSFSNFNGIAFPLSVEAMINNLFGAQPILNLILRGRLEFEDKSYCTYYTQLGYYTYYTTSQNSTTSFNIAYYKPNRYSLQLGDVGGFGLPITGKGATGTLRLNKRIELGVMFTELQQNSYYYKQQQLSFGVFGNFTLFNRQVLSFAYGHSDNPYSHISSDFYSSSGRFNFLRKHTLSIGLIETTSSSIYSYYLLGLNSFFSYTGSFLKNKMHDNANGYYREQYTSETHYYTKNLSNRLSYGLDKTNNIALINNFSQYLLTSTINNLTSRQFNYIVYNQINFSHIIGTETISPNIFYNITQSNGITTDSKGLGLGYSSMNTATSFRYVLNLTGAYNHFENISSSPEFFTFKASGFMYYKTNSILAQYNYGPLNITDTTLFNSGYSYPQSAIITLQNQYQFRNPRFVLQSSFTYRINTQYSQNSLGVYPELHYNTPEGWHLKLMIGYNFSSVNYTYASSAIASLASSESSLPTGPQYSSNLNINLGIKKDFAIPIPKKWVKKKYASVKFKAFYDVNGNHKMDPGEVALENIVIRLDGEEVLTNEEGTATLKNIPAGYHPFSTFSLVQLNGWFPWLNDSILITDQKEILVPYVRGVKIYGSVVVERARFASDMERPLDLSNIKISATDGITLETHTGVDGQFVLYVPYGSYVLTMDESILGKRYSLSKNNIPLELTEGMESMFNTFYIIEKRRKESIQKFDIEDKKSKK